MSRTMLCNAALKVRLSNLYSSFKPNFSRIFCSGIKPFDFRGSTVPLLDWQSLKLNCSSVMSIIAIWYGLISQRIWVFNSEVIDYWRTYHIPTIHYAVWSRQMYLAWNEKPQDYKHASAVISNSYLNWDAATQHRGPLCIKPDLCAGVRRFISQLGDRRSGIWFLFVFFILSTQWWDLILAHGVSPAHHFRFISHPISHCIVSIIASSVK
jgi:hypothetical protein